MTAFWWDLHNSLCSAAGVILDPQGWRYGLRPWVGDGMPFGLRQRHGVAEDSGAESCVPALPQEAGRSQLTGVHFLCPWPAQEDSSDRAAQPFLLVAYTKNLEFLFSTVNLYLASSRICDTYYLYYPDWTDLMKLVWQNDFGHHSGKAWLSIHPFAQPLILTHPLFLSPFCLSTIGLILKSFQSVPSIPATIPWPSFKILCSLFWIFRIAP